MDELPEHAIGEVNLGEEEALNVLELAAGEEEALNVLELAAGEEENLNVLELAAGTELLTEGGRDFGPPGLNGFGDVSGAAVLRQCPGLGVRGGFGELLMPLALITYEDWMDRTCPVRNGWEGRSCPPWPSEGTGSRAARRSVVFRLHAIVM